MDFPADLGDAANYSQLSGTLLAFMQVVPPGVRRHKADPKERQAAYLEFQSAIWEFVTIVQTAATYADWTPGSFVDTRSH